MNSFKKFLSNKYKSSNTMETYLIALNSFLKWYSHTYGLEMKILHKETILDFISYMKTIKESNAKTLRLYIHAIETYAEYKKVNEELDMWEIVVWDTYDQAKQWINGSNGTIQLVES